MAGLQRSAISFRRQGSSGLVWEDRFISGELNQNKNKEEEQQQNQQGEGVEFRELRTSRSVGSIGGGRMMERSRSNGGGGGGGGGHDRHHRTGKVSPALDPPSPKLSGCGFCAVFGKPVGTHRSKTGKNKKRKS